MKTSNIKVSKFVMIITFLTGLIATILGVWATISLGTHPQFFEGAHKLVLSWSARELGMGIGALSTVFFFKDARAYAIILLSCWIREILDFIDFFRIEDTTPTRLYLVVGISVVLHGIAFFISIEAIRNHNKVFIISKA